jgi:SAM-dependent methyltransferase
MSSQFDAWADDYENAVAQGLAVTGEDRQYFARERIDWLASRLGLLDFRPASILDFGCSTGSSAPMLREALKADSVVGTDVSARSVQLAAERYERQGTRFVLTEEFKPREEFDLAYCNGVFHHIPVGERPSSVAYIHRALRPGGLFAFWDNNPWNPGTHYVMRRIPFDHDAVTLTAREARRLLAAGGFEILHTDFLFIFPRALRWFRALERPLSRWPLGVQYQVLCRKQ